jgi:hypothetical protein
MKDNFLKGNKYFGIDQLLLVLILFVGAILRFYNYAELPYSYDEFSALFRTRFDNFSDLIYYGVKTTDTHPAGVQVFMYFWVNLFGESEMVVKFPFVIFGLLAIVMAYKVGSLWFNKTVGLFVVLFLSVLQYPITYSQFARPYASGLFFAILMVWFWTHVVFYPEKKRILNRVGFIISAAICAYNHHFSLFLAGLVGISGLFFIKKSAFKSYLLVCLSVVILYLPHLPIFFVQLQRGGVESWLHKPEPRFILDYFGYILHFSNLLIILTLIIIASGIVFTSKEILTHNKFRVLAFSWFAVTYLVGYFYSVYINALLQYSVLIFVFPFLVMFVFSFYKNINFWLKSAIILLFAITAVYTLVFERKHYEIMYQSVFKEILLESDNIIRENKNKKVTVVYYMPDKIREYYVRKYGIDDADFYHLDSIGNFIQFREFISRQSSDLLVLGWNYIPNIEYKLITEEIYPYLIQKKSWFTGDFYVYSRNKPDDPGYVFADSIIFKAMNTFDTLTAGWENVVLFYQLTPGVNYKEDMILRFNKEFEYSPKFKAKVKNIINKRTNELIISVDAYMPDKLVNPQLICDFRLNKQILEWRSCNVLDFVDAPQKRLRAYFAIRLIDRKIHDPETEIWVYFWNKNGEEIYLDNFSVEVREGNPLIYGLFDRIY